MENIRIISVDGNVGVGKSTLIEQLHEIILEHDLESKVCLIPEPVDLWDRFLQSAPQGRRTYSALQTFYRDPERLSYAFQMFVLITLDAEFDMCVIKHLETYGEYPGICVVERFQNWVARYTFVQDFVDRGFWLPEEYDFYTTTWEYVVHKAKLSTPIHWYVQCSPQSCRARIGERGRAGENALSVTALTRLHHLFERWSVNHLHEDDRVINTEMNHTNPNNKLWLNCWLSKELLNHVLHVYRDVLPTANLVALEGHRVYCTGVCATLPIQLV